jgi:3-isopropylmalate/(R)-2-methylmalate dehydratase large subunit
MTGRTLYDKIWDDHVVSIRDDGTALIGIDRHIIHEVTTPQAFESLRLAGRRVRHPELTLAVPDHNVPTTGRDQPIADIESRQQVSLLATNAAEFGIEHIGMTAPEQGIVHVVGPEQGFTLPGTTVVCGDSHTSTHGALGALGFGIGTSEIEHVFATQTLLLRKSKNLLVRIEGALPEGVSAKDMALAVIRRLGTAGGTGHVIEFAGSAIRDLSIEGRMTLCNMAIEAGARSGLVTPDDKTIDYVRGRPRAPRGADLEAAIAWWKTLKSDTDAVFDHAIDIDASALVPMVSWGTSPEDVVGINETVPNPDGFPDRAKQQAAAASLAYMDLCAGQPMMGLPIENIFIGSCTNSRIEDLRAAARVVRGQKIAPNIRQALVVPGSGLVRLQAEREGLDRIFIDAGFQWREPGCSACLGMNPDKIPAQERCASTSNRNFMGRQGPGARTHLVSPATAAATAIAGVLTDPRVVEVLA